MFKYASYDDDKEPNAPTERMSIAEVLELAERYKAAYYDYDLFMVLEHYIELLQSADGQMLLVQCHPEREEMRGTAIEQLCLEFIIHS